MNKQLKNTLALVKSEYHEKVEVILNNLKAKWSDLSDDEKEEYYDTIGTIGFVFEDNESAWNDIDVYTICVDDSDDTIDTFMDRALDYICD